MNEEKILNNIETALQQSGEFSYITQDVAINGGLCLVVKDRDDKQYIIEVNKVNA